MSADNYLLVRPFGLYLLVRPFGDKWTFTMEFASDDTALSAPDDRYGVWDTRTDALYAAHQYASENIVEYGVQLMAGTFTFAESAQTGEADVAAVPGA